MHLDDNQKITIIGLIVAILVGSGYYFYNHLVVPAPANEIIESSATTEATSSSEIIIYISGAVYREGVYRVKSQSRIFEIIKLAGGGLTTADFSPINLAEIVKDGQKITIPFKNLGISESQYQGSTLKSSSIPQSKKININTSSASELDALPGVGPSTAKQIIEARPFSKLEDISKISRFGKNKFEKIKDWICL